MSCPTVYAWACTARADRAATSPVWTRTPPKSWANRRSISARNAGPSGCPPRPSADAISAAVARLPSRSCRSLRSANSSRASSGAAGREAGVRVGAAWVTCCAWSLTAPLREGGTGSRLGLGGDDLRVEVGALLLVGLVGLHVDPADTGPGIVPGDRHEPVHGRARLGRADGEAVVAHRGRHGHGHEAVDRREVDAGVHVQRREVVR